LAKNLTLEVDMSPALASKSFRGDASRLRQVLLNLTGNAVRFTSIGGIHVTVALAEQSETDALLRFEVADSGIGIGAADRAHLFGMFEHIAGSTGSQPDDAGLRLALSRRLAEAMGGSIGVESRDGPGSTFWFTARVKKQQANQPGTSSANGVGAALEALKGKLSGNRLLLVDENEDTRALLQGQLRPVWKSIDVATDGSEALDMAGKRRYDLILMDMRMPRMNGLEATQRIRQLPGRADVPILAMTANVYPEDRARCLAAGMNDFIPKAVSAEAPFEMILKWLESPG
jgi:CheY-like chemotaxis protein